MRIEAGSVFCIPLFMQKDDWKLETKLSDSDLEKEFAFGRVIETSSSVLVEIFRLTGSAKTEMEKVVNSGVMFSPVQIFWDGIKKKRWRIIGRTENYDKFRDSNYHSLFMVFPPIADDVFRLMHLATQKETPISRDELTLKCYETSVVWWPIDLEKRILESLDKLDYEL